MSKIEGIFSIRLVIADFYMEKPTFGLDPCYSEDRGKEIKRVPIIRVFGCNSEGRKTCMHVHGVFPYFYIPYEKKEFESLSKAVYQIATNLDKAINISLGQGSSSAQHVFKIQLVKGIPFYGYHRTDHQYLKIYMFNPRFVRRAANLLQNGAIMNKNYHPHESHVPYILQFMIDHNLYGMSFVHVPLEIIKFRKNREGDVLAATRIQTPKILGPITKVSTSTLEVDIGSNFILNRFQLVAKSNRLHSNPGIESIWHDERLRRQKLAISLAEDEEVINTIPPLEIPGTQERPNVQLTESETFHRTALLSKLLSLDLSTSGSGNLADQTLNCTVQSNVSNITLNATSAGPKEMRRTFNLKKLLAHAIYPEECSQNERLTNASYIENHLPGSNVFQTSISGRSSTNMQDESIKEPNSEEFDFLDDTLVDEALVLSLTQQHVPLNASLREEDMELLDVLQQLEADSENNQQIDLDSTLAPLSQTHRNLAQTPEVFDKETAAIAANQPLPDIDAESDSDTDGNMLDFSIAMDDIDELILKLTQSQPTQTKPTATKPVPQVDGPDDALCTPKKRVSTNSKPPTIPPLTPKTPKNKTARSPRTPKTRAAYRYAPLGISLKSESGQKNLNRLPNETTPVKTNERATEVDHFKSALFSLSKKLVLSEMCRKNGGDSNEVRQTEEHFPKLSERSSKTLPRRSRRTTDLDKTHITCSLTPRRKSERLLRVYDPEKDAARENLEKHAATKKKSTSLESQTERCNKEMKNPTRSSKRLKARDSDAHKEHGAESSLASFNPEENSKEEISKTVVTPTKENANETLENPEALPTTDPQEDLKEPAEEEDEEIVASDNEESLATNLKIFTRSIRKGYHRTGQTFGKMSPAGPATSNSSKLFEVQEGAVIDSPKNLAATTPSVEPRLPLTPNLSESMMEDDESILRYSIYEDDSRFNSPSVFSEALSPAFMNGSVELGSPTPLRLSCSTGVDAPCSTPGEPVCLPQSSSSTSSGIENFVVVTPLNLPPTREEVLASCEKFNIYEYEFQKPFYSNPDDITKQKEVGFTVLQIPGNKLNDCPEFESVLGAEAKGLADWRRKKLVEIGGPSMLNRHRNAQCIREYFATKKKLVITPQISAPSRQEAKIWIKARELLKGQGNQRELEKDMGIQKRIDEDSPIKVRRQRVTMMFHDEATASGADGDDDMDCTTRSLSLTPMTPGNVLTQSQSKLKMRNQSFTPLTSITEDSPGSGKSASKQRRRSKRAKLSLNAKLNAALEAGSLKMDAVPAIKCIATELLLESGDSNSTGLKTSRSSMQNTPSSDTSVPDEMVLAALEQTAFLKQLHSGSSAHHDDSFGLSSATLDNTFGFKVNLENLQQAKSDIEYNYLTTVSLEVFVPTRDDLLPNPQLDEIRCIFYAIENSIPPAEPTDKDAQTPLQLPRKACGYIIVNDARDIVANEGRKHGIDGDIDVKVAPSEIEAIQALLELIARWDPDIYAGYEIEMASWGYVMERAKYLCLNIGPLLSRVPSQKIHEFVDEDRDQFTDLDFEMKLCGRILLDVWRLMRSEIALTSYTFENVMYHIRHKRCPWHSFRDLTTWFASPCSRWIVLEYYLERVRGTLSLLDQLDLIGRTSEMAKLIGIQFYEVLSRGSQFRVESMMLRIAKPKNLVPVSPSVQQRAHMRAPEYLPLILEPQSRFYPDPLIVLDFQSLYPSMIIAYNYCFSTCLGRVEHLGQSSPFEFGASQLRVSPTMLRKLVDRDLITISPCGAVFVKSSVREGILPRMLKEILDTRLMVKQSMKLHKSNTALQRILHSRQLGLKLMANVTYGYTAANFSGRMPAVEVGDSVVAKGRETLERAIKMVETNEKWNVRVVYGDTDSLFVLVPGRNRQQAFKIGEEIVEAITQANPHPVKLKLEKVYQPCILQTKKRYVGYMYETADQADPVYEAKGIETVRRDGCPAVAKMLEKVLRILFETADVSQVKQYVCRQFTKLLSGRANLQDLIFAKEFRGLNGYKPRACVPALELTRKWLQTDPRHIPRRGERVPFIIINGPPGVPLIRLIRSPHEVLANEGFKINAIYYITKAIIPPLNRCLLLIGADVNEWFANLPRKVLMTPALCSANEIISSTTISTNCNQLKKSTISQYFSSTHCIIDCGRQTKEGICAGCAGNPTKTFITLQEKIGKIERAYYLTQQICQACCGRVGDLKCGSLDCPVMYVLEVKRRDLQQIGHFRKLMERF